MKAIFEEYGGPILVAVVLVALLAIVGVLLAGDGVVATNFSGLITSLFSRVSPSGV